MLLIYLPQLVEICLHFLVFFCKILLIFEVVLILAEKAECSRWSFNLAFIYRHENVVETSTVVPMEILTTLVTTDAGTIFVTSEAAVLCVLLEMFQHCLNFDPFRGLYVKVTVAISLNAVLVKVNLIFILAICDKTD